MNIPLDKKKICKMPITVNFRTYRTVPDITLCASVPEQKAESVVVDQVPSLLHGSILRPSINKEDNVTPLGITGKLSLGRHQYTLLSNAAKYRNLMEISING